MSLIIWNCYTKYKLFSQDPEGHSLVYSVVAGSLPPGIKLEASSGRIHGIIPDSDATYTVTVRATDNYGHFADSVLKIVTRGTYTVILS